MAIRQMKKLYLLAVRSKKDALLRELIKHGCVEFSEMEGDIEGSEFEGLLTREDSQLSALKAQQSTLSHAVELLDKYAPAKSKLLAAKPEVDGAVLMDMAGSEKRINAQRKASPSVQIQKKQ